jgi:imidazolonepropionase-like amidohydrolase
MLLAGCQNSSVKVLIGGTAIVAPGAQPIQDSVIVVADGRIRSVGVRKDVPIPQDSERTDVSGKWIVPADNERLAINESADLMILDRAPDGVKPALPADVSRRMRNGQWETKP